MPWSDQFTGYNLHSHRQHIGQYCHHLSLARWATSLSDTNPKDGFFPKIQQNRGIFVKNRHIQFDKGLSLSAFWQRYGSEEDCREALFNWMWPNGYHCRKCGYETYLLIKDGKAYQCQRCQHTAPTYMKTFLLIDKLPLRSLFLIRYMFFRLRNSLSTPVTRPIYRKVLALVRIIRKTFGDVYHALLRDEHCAVYIPWAEHPRCWSIMTKIHWCYTKIEWQNRKLYSIISVVVWPLKALFFAFKRTMQLGPRVKRRTGIPKTRQFFDQLCLAIRHFIPPYAFYFYELYDPSNYKLASKIIHNHEILALLPFINSLKDREILNNKCKFHQECEKAGLPTIPIIAEFEGGKITSWADDTYGEILKADLFVKPTRGRQGLGARLYKYHEDGRYRKDDGLLLAFDELLNHLSESSREEPYLLQKRIFNHPDISELSTGALCTIRIVTCRPPGGPPKLLISVFKMPTGMSSIDNMRAGALGSPVDEKSGILGEAIAMDPAAERVSRHPDTNHKIVGVRVPFWPRVIELSILAHDAFPYFSSIGWDIAVTKDGPLLVEGNLLWGIESLQRTHNQPLGETSFPEIYLLDLVKQKRFTAKARSHLLPTS
jgi:hypothetical protein